MSMKKRMTRTSRLNLEGEGTKRKGLMQAAMQARVRLVGRPKRRGG